MTSVTIIEPLLLLLLLVVVVVVVLLLLLLLHCIENITKIKILINIIVIQRRTAHRKGDRHHTHRLDGAASRQRGDSDVSSSSSSSSSSPS